MERPLTNRPGYPNDSLPFSTAYYWDVRDALHAGPVLISDGEIDLNIEDEVFFNTQLLEFSHVQQLDIQRINI